MIPTRNVTDALVKGTVAKGEMLLPTLKSFVQNTCSLHATKHA